jgi:hypothetical protein
VRAVGVLVITSSLACAREPRDVECPDVAAGDLVLSEVRGSQSGADTWGEWVEVYNATDAPIGLAGTLLVFTKLDGSDERRIVVRARDVSVPARGYAVLGRFAHEQRPAHIDYGWAEDSSDDMFPAAAVRIDACGVEIDRAIYRDLPAMGTLALDGAAPPDAAANDVEGAWCPDTNPGPPTELGLPGTPGEANPPGN